MNMRFFVLMIFGIFITGCSLPVCHDGNMICGINENGEIVTYHSDLCTSDSDCGQTVNETPCQLYRCQNDNFEQLENGYCDSGSRLLNGVLSCIPRCDSLPAHRCKSDNDQTIVQTCSNDTKDIWITSACNNSCRFDTTNTDYEEDGFKAGECGECRDDMQPYCQQEGSLLTLISCENGTQVKKIITPDDPNVSPICPIPYQTKCDNVFVFTHTDTHNCGECGNACKSGDQCINGQCSTCDEDGYLDYTLDDKPIRAYCIHDASELKAFHDSLASGKSYPENNTANNYIIVSDIIYDDLWEPLGTEEHPVDGITLIGANHSITFFTPITGDTYVGVFGYVQNSIFDSLNIKDIKVNQAGLSETPSYNDDSTRFSLGSLIGYAEQVTVQNSRFNVHLVANYRTGGIIGYADNSTLNNVQVSGDIQIDQNNQIKRLPVGGIVGSMRYSKMTYGHSNSLFKSLNDTMLEHIGGLVGETIEHNIIDHSDRDGDIILQGDNIGGLIGYAKSSSKVLGLELSYSYFNGKIYSQDTEPYINTVGGLIGAFTGTGRLDINACYVRGEISALYNVGGYIGALFKTYDNESQLMSDSLIVINGCEQYKASNGIISCDKPLNNDITIHAPDAQNGGLIAIIDEKFNIHIDSIFGEIKLDSNNGDMGGIIGMTMSDLNITDTNLKIDINISKNDNYTSSNIGGVIGTSIDASFIILNSQFNINIQAETSENVGGIFGKLSTTVEYINDEQIKHYSTVYIDNNSLTETLVCLHNCGGMIGSIPPYDPELSNSGDGLVKATISSNKLDHITLSGKSDIGGIIGYSRNGEFMMNDNEFKNLTINTQYNSGGIIGNSSDTMEIQYNYFDNFTINGVETIGGLIGHYYGKNISISGLYLNSSVYGTNHSVGGLIGKSSIGKIYVLSSLLNLKVNGLIEAGGLISSQDSGYFVLSSSAIIGRIFNTEETEDSSLGGIFHYGFGSLNISYSYSLTDMSLASTSIPMGILAVTLFLNADSYTRPAFGLYYWEEMMSPAIFIDNYDDTPATEALLSQPRAFHVNQNKQLMTYNNDGTEIALAKTIGMHECVINIGDFSEKLHGCYHIPYPTGIEEMLTGHGICIPEDKIAAECSD